MGETKEGDSKQPAGLSPRRRRVPKVETSINGLSSAPRESHNQPRRSRAKNGGTEPPANAVVADPVASPETAARGQKKEGQGGKKPRRKQNKKAKKGSKRTQPQDPKVEDLEAIAGDMEKLSLNPGEDEEKNQEATSGPSDAPPSPTAAPETTARGRKEGQGGKKPRRKQNKKAKKGPKRTQPQDPKVEDLEAIAGDMEKLSLNPGEDEEKNQEATSGPSDATPSPTAAPETTARGRKEEQGGKKPRRKQNKKAKKGPKRTQPQDRTVENVYEKKNNEEARMSDERRRKMVEEKEALKEERRRLREKSEEERRRLREKNEKERRRLREERREDAAARVDVYFGDKSHLRILRDMCRKLLNLTEEKLPRTVREGKRLLQDIYLNIFDFVDHDGYVPENLRFANIDDLIDRCEALREGRHAGSSGHKVGYYPINRAKGLGLKDLLRSLFFGRRRRGGG